MVPTRLPCCGLRSIPLHCLWVAAYLLSTGSTYRRGRYYAISGYHALGTDTCSFTLMCIRTDERLPTPFTFCIFPTPATTPLLRSPAYNIHCNASHTLTTNFAPLVQFCRVMAYRSCHLHRLLDLTHTDFTAWGHCFSGSPVIEWIGPALFEESLSSRLPYLTASRENMGLPIYPSSPTFVDTAT